MNDRTHFLCFFWESLGFESDGQCLENSLYMLSGFLVLVLCFYQAGGCFQSLILYLMQKRKLSLTFKKKILKELRIKYEIDREQEKLKNCPLPNF